MGVTLHAITKRYGTVEVLQPFSLAVEPGEFLTLLGPSGSGKTTVLKLIGGFTEPSGGTITFDGRDITRDPPNRRPFNTVFQDYALFPHMTVAQNVGYGPLVQRRSGEAVRRLIDETIEVVGLSSLQGRFPAQLSGGQKQRVALARAIVCEPAVILLDEPLAALDATLRKQMQLFLKAIQRRIRTTFIFVTHDQDEAITMSDRIVVMRAGRIEQLGTPRAVYFQPATRFVAGFIGENNLLAAKVTAPGVAETAVGRLGFRPETAASSGWLSFRPETLRFASEGIPARVEEATFAGAITRVTLRPDAAPDQTLILHLTGDAATQSLEPGASVHVAHDPARTVLIGDAP